MNDDERWAPCDGWPYEISTMGRVRRTVASKTSRAGQILRPMRLKSGYLLACFATGTKGRTKKFLIHRLVAAAFIGPCKDGHEVNHKNGDKVDNRLDNLEYMTRSENHHHAAENGLRPRTKRHASEVIQRVRQLRAGGMTHAAIASQLGIPIPTVASMLHDPGVPWMAYGRSRARKQVLA